MSHERYSHPPRGVPSKSDGPRAFKSSPPLTGVDELKRYHELQRVLEERWGLLRDIDAGPRDVVVIPSLSLDGFAASSIPGFHLYEERMLFTLMLLRHPRARLVYVTSQPVHPSALDYQIALLTGIPTAHARERLTLLECYDSSPRPLTEKILERPRLIERIRRSIDPSRAHMTCFAVTHRERSLAVQLGIPLYGVDPDLAHLGSKSGSRKVFRKAGVAMAPGVEDIRSEQEIADAVADLWEADDSMRRVCVKHNEGFSGEGNALLDLEAIREVAPGEASHTSRVDAVLGHLGALRPVAEHESSRGFLQGMERMGGVVEAWVEGVVKRSPSAQLRVNPRLELEALSTHDQILAEDGQTYLGCTFPADAAYRLAIQEDALKVGRVLRDEGALGRFSVDFLTVQRSPGKWDQLAIEINLRMSGTTHPLMTLHMLSHGHYDSKTGEYFTARGEPRCYIATDALSHPNYRGLLVEDLLDVAAVHGLHYRPWMDKGVVFHLAGALSQYGKVGVVAVGETPEEAKAWFDATRTALDTETGATGVVPVHHGRTTWPAG
jgi:hypothetical protein